jgi:hypothetical protein
MSGSRARWWQRSSPSWPVIAAAVVTASCQHLTRVTPPPVVAHGIAGVVYDSLSHHALQGATVQLVDAEHPQAQPVSLETNDRGEYAAANLPPGHYLATFYHHALDSLGLRANATMVDVTHGGAWVPLSIPSAEHLRTAECGPRAVVDSTGLMVGRVLDASTRLGAAKVDVTARWTEVMIAAGQGVTTRAAAATSTTTDDGWFALCGVPDNVEVTVQAMRDSEQTGAVGVRVPTNGLALHDLVIGGPVLVAVRGNVVGSNGGPIPHAHVTLDGHTEVMADDNGVFTIVARRAGTQLLATRAIGFYPDERAVNVVPDSNQWVEVELPTVASVLDTVHINGKRLRDLDAHGFEGRRQAGIGTFFSQSDLKAMAPKSVTEILNHSSRTAIVRMANGRTGLRIRGDPCLPVLYVNGMAMPVLEDLDELNHLVDLEEIQQMEIYTPGETPREFARQNQCAVIVVWTRR